MTFWHSYLGFAGGGTATVEHTITIDFSTSVTSGPAANETDGTRKVIANVTPGDAAVVYVFEETEVS